MRGAGTRPKDIPRNLKQYYLCFLVKGERWNEIDGEEALMQAQLAFLREQLEWQRYKIAGPVTGGEDTDVIGFSIVEAASADAALALANQDPAVRAGRATVRILPAILPSLDTLKIEY